MDREHRLRRLLLQRASLAYRRAVSLEATQKGYLQGVAVETPEHTVAFRMDSKQQFLSAKGALSKRHMYVFVPVDAVPDAFLNRIWLRHVEANETEAMFEIDAEGVRPYMHKNDRTSEARELFSKGLSEEIEVFDEELVLGSVQQHLGSIKGLREMNHAFRAGFEIVPFDS